MQAPTSAASSSATLLSATSTAMISMVRPEMVETPAASPSSPSMRLTEFVMITIQTIVTGMEKPFKGSRSMLPKIKGFVKVSITMPCSTAMTAAMI